MGNLLWERYPIGEMNWSDWHFIVIEDDDGKAPFVYHPESCNLSINTIPDEINVEYLCPVSQEISMGGVASLFYGHPSIEEDGLPNIGSMWMVRCRYFEHAGGPWGPSEWDQETEVVRIRCAD